jgi:hypothetical protein
MRAPRCVALTVSALLGAGAAMVLTPLAAADPASDSPGTPIITTVPEQPLPAGNTAFSDNPAIVDGRLQSIESWSRVPEPDALAVQFTTGTPECFGVHAEVQETADIVAVKLQSGTVPEAVDRACIAIAVLGTLTVQLDAPVGDRAVVSIT